MYVTSTLKSGTTLNSFLIPCVCLSVCCQVVTRTVLEIGNAMQDSDLAVPFHIDADKVGKLTEIPFQVG